MEKDACAHGFVDRYNVPVSVRSSLMGRSLASRASEKTKWHLFSLICLAALIFIAAFPVFAFGAEDGFLAGYATAVLERELNLRPLSLQAKDGVVTVRFEGISQEERERVIASLSGIQGVTGVEVQPSFIPQDSPPALTEADKEAAGMASAGLKPSSRQILPSGRLFEPLIADPRWPHFSVSYHYYAGDEELRNVGSTSFGETLIFFRGNAFFGGMWDIGLQAGVFAVFDLDADSLDLVNADYWVGIPVSYRYKDLSALIRVFHQSSHLGDEYLLRSRVDRVNLSYEGVDAKVSLDLADWLRVYGGGGFIFHKEPSDLKPWSTQLGLEVKSAKAYWDGVLRPVAGADFKNWEETGWNTDISLRLGFQIESKKTLGHKIQFVLEYFRGNTPNGQFYDTRIEYYGLGTHFYF